MAASLSLSAAEVHVWLAFYGEIADPRLHASYRELLSREERLRETRFHFADDRRRYLVTRAMVRMVLSRYVPVEPADWVFSANSYGRPQAVNSASTAAALSFNLSHTHGLIALGITAHRDLGVDVESTRRTVSPSLAAHCFAPQEVAALAAVPPAGKHYRFFEYWTFKESYIKARGMGLSLPLDQFAFHFPDDVSVNVEFHPGLTDNSSRWQFWQLKPTPDYLLAVCAQRLPVSSRLVVRNVVPGEGEQMLLPNVSRVSL